MIELDEIYKKILLLGLTSLRDAAERGDMQQCKAEAEHLHNLPSLIGESNIKRHLYYISTEKTNYLGWVLSMKRKDLMEYISMAYLPYWKQIEEILGVDKILNQNK